MKSLFRNIISWTLAAVFLVSFTGFRLLLHHCPKSNKRIVMVMFHPSPASGCAFHQKGSAQKLSDEQGEGQRTFSCSQNADHIQHKGSLVSSPSCCNTLISYLKEEYNFTSGDHVLRIEPLPMDLLKSTWQEYFFANRVADIPNGVFSDRAPPIGLVGKPFVIYAHQIKIC